MIDSERESGHYHIKLTPGSKWTVGYWNSRVQRWSDGNFAGFVAEDVFKVVPNRIPSPNESPEFVFRSSIVLSTNIWDKIANKYGSYLATEKHPMAFIDWAKVNYSFEEPIKPESGAPFDEPNAFNPDKK